MFKKLFIALSMVAVLVAQFNQSPITQAAKAINNQPIVSAPQTDKTTFDPIKRKLTPKIINGELDLESDIKLTGTEKQIFDTCKQTEKLSRSIRNKNKPTACIKKPTLVNAEFTDQVYTTLFDNIQDKKDLDDGKNMNLELKLADYIDIKDIQICNNSDFNKSIKSISAIPGLKLDLVPVCGGATSLTNTVNNVLNNIPAFGTTSAISSVSSPISSPITSSPIATSSITSAITSSSSTNKISSNSVVISSSSVVVSSISSVNNTNNSTTTNSLSSVAPILSSVSSTPDSTNGIKVGILDFLFGTVKASAVGPSVYDYRFPYPKDTRIATLRNFDDGSTTHSGHNAIDFYSINNNGTKYNSDIVAAKGGKVVVSSGDANYLGNHIVVLQDDGNYAVYAHLSARVALNTTLKRGEYLGRQGQTGAEIANTDNYHLHFEVLQPTIFEYSGYINGKDSTCQNGWNSSFCYNVFTLDKYKVKPIYDECFPSRGGLAEDEPDCKYNGGNTGYPYKTYSANYWTSINGTSSTPPPPPGITDPNITSVLPPMDNYLWALDYRCKNDPEVQIVVKTRTNPTSDCQKIRYNSSNNTMTNIYGKCMDAGDINSSTNRWLRFSGCHGGNNQKWRQNSAGQIWSFQKNNSNQSVCIEYDQLISEYGIQPLPCSSSTKQKWYGDLSITQEEIPTTTTSSSSTITPSSTTSTTAKAPRLGLKVFLAGAYNDTTKTMSTELNSKNYIPIQQPYNVAPWNYSGSESIPARYNIDPNVTDWVLLEIKNSSGTIVLRKAVLLRKDGYITDPAVGGSAISAPYLDGLPVSSGGYRIVVRHRNHLAVAQDLPFPLVQDQYHPYEMAYNNNLRANNQKLIGKDSSGKDMYGLREANVNGDTVINATDKGLGSNATAAVGYYNTDINLDSVVNATDKAVIRLAPAAAESV